MVAIEPAERLAERAPRQVHAVQPSVALARDQPRLLEHAHVPGDRGRRHVERLGQFADAGRAFRQPLEHTAADGVGQRTEHGVERVGLTVNHVVNYGTAGARMQGVPGERRRL